MLLLSINAWCQQQIKGKIIDAQTKTPLVGATIYILELNKGTITNEKGEFVLENITNTSYTLQISFIGFQTVIQSINLIENNVEIELKKTAFNINEVVISSSFINTQDENTGAVDVVKKSVMQKYGATTIMDIINKIPGVDAETTGPMVTRPVIRGLSSNRVLTVTDGARFETQQWDDEHGIGVNELGIDRIEIIKGPSSLLYGPESMGGVINLIDEQPAAIGKTVGDVRASLFSNNLGMLTNFNIKGAKEKYNWGVNALGKLFSDYFYNGYDFRVPNTRLLEFGAKGYFSINRKWGSSKITYLFNDAYYGILDAKDVVKNPDGSIVNTDTLEKAKFPLEIEAPFHSVVDNRINSKTIFLLGKSKAELILGYQNNHRIENEEAAGKKRGEKYLDMTLKTSTYSLKWYSPEIKKFTTIIGMQGMYQQNSNASDAQTQLIPKATIKDLGFLAVTKYKIKKLNFSLGVRYDARFLNTKTSIIDSTVNLVGIEKDYNNVSSSIGIAYNINKKIIVRTSFATGYRPPNLNELLANGVKLESLRFEKGNEDLKKEQNFEWDANITYSTNNFSITAAGYINKINNFIYIAPTGNIVPSFLQKLPLVPEYQFLQDDAEIKGAEASIIIHPTTILWLNYEAKAATLTARRDNDNSYLPMMPTNKIYNTLIFNVHNIKSFKNISIRIGAVTALKQFKVAANEKKTPSYTLLNASVATTINNFELSLTANNIFDRKYFDNMSRFRTFDIYNAGLNISFSIKKYFDFSK